MTDNKKDNQEKGTSGKGDIKSDINTQTAYIAQKTERLAGALYAVTRLFPESEPLRSRIRRQALTLVSAAHTTASSEQNPHTSIPLLLRRLRSQLKVARDGGLLSVMNFSVLNDEMADFISEAEEIGVIPETSLSSGYFDSEISLPTVASASRNTKTSDSSKINSSDAKAVNSDNTKDKGKLSAKERRRKQIIELFDEQEEITINDVTEVINGYSTKTIQRDLKALVKSGQLEKHGKRRWSYYTRA